MLTTEELAGLAAALRAAGVTLTPPVPDRQRPHRCVVAASTCRPGPR
ncbi:hypothetical protein [Mycolicibacterium llatzerense]|nr:hypothetical protein [Mycolicibacterium llatzerense]